MEADMKKVVDAKAEKLKINGGASGWVLPEVNGFRKLIIYSVNSNFIWVSKVFRKNHGKNDKKKKQAR